MLPKPPSRVAWLHHPSLPPGSVGVPLLPLLTLALDWGRPLGLARVLPRFTPTTAAPTCSSAQRLFTGVCSLALCGVFVLVQAVRHRDYFLPVGVDNNEGHAAPPSVAVAWASAGALLSLGGGAGLAEAPALDAAVAAAGAVIAMIVLLPDTAAALRAQRGKRMQSLPEPGAGAGSGLASTGLTIPVAAALPPLLPFVRVLGLPPMQSVPLALTRRVGPLTLGAGRATRQQGAVHLVLWAAFLCLPLVP